MHVGEELRQLEISLEDRSIVLFIRTLGYQGRVVFAAERSQGARAAGPERFAYADTDMSVGDICGGPNEALAVVGRIFALIDEAKGVLVKGEEVGDSQSDTNMHPGLLVFFAFADLARPSLRIGRPLGQQEQGFYGLNACIASCREVGDEVFHVLGACFVDVRFVDEVLRGYQK